MHSFAAYSFVSTNRIAWELKKDEIYGPQYDKCLSSRVIKYKHRALLNASSSELICDCHWWTL